MEKEKSGRGGGRDKALSTNSRSHMKVRTRGMLAKRVRGGRIMKV